VVEKDSVTLLLRGEKGQKKLQPGQRTVRQIPSRKMPRVAALLRAFFAGHSSMKGLHGQRLRRWALPPQEDKNGISK